MISQNKNTSGLTLLEVMIATAILVIAISGLLATFTGLFSLNENARNLSLAIISAQDKMEEIRESNFNNIYNTYNNASFDVAGFDPGEAKGSISIDNSDPDLLEVYASVSWRERSNRIIGEDVNLNGSLDAGEDLNTDNRLNSPAEIASLMGNR